MKVGAILRCSASDETKVEHYAVKAITAARRLKLSGWVERVDILVSQSKDCGKTAEYLRDNIGERNHIHNWAHIHEVIPTLDIYCAMLNYGCAFQIREGCTHSFILSSEAISYLSDLTLEKLMLATHDRSSVVGLATDELRDMVLAGQVENTCAIWDLPALLTVGGFDLHGAPSQMEEVIPLFRLYDAFGPGVAVILPEGSGGQYAPPDPKVDPERFAAHERKMASKIERKQLSADTIGRKLDELRGAILPGYPR